VLDDKEALHGWIAADDTGGTGGTVASRAQRMNAWVPVGASLKRAFSEMLQQDAGWVAVLDGERFLGVLTPSALHEALRRSVESDAKGVDRHLVEVESVRD
jgi:osmoprotectant transport system ATP-binding protein